MKKHASPYVPRKVVIALRMAGIAGQDKLNGIFEHIGNGHRWQLALCRSAEEFSPDIVRSHLNAGVDGFIVGIPDVSESLEVLAHTKVPTVVMNIELGPLRRRRRNIFLIRGDDLAVGRGAANEFLRSGRFQTYAYLPYNGNPIWSRERGSGFAERLRTRGLKPSIFDRSVPLSDWLTSLARPAAVFASCDDDAYAVLDVCRARGFSVSSEIAVLGVNNDPILCENAEPRLSSIQPDNIGAGRVAARLLERMMDDNCRHPNANQKLRTHLVASKGIVVRESTPPASVSDALLKRALGFIEQRALKGIRVDDVAISAGVSRSLLDLRFRECLHVSVYDTILQYRLNEVKRLLRTTDRPIPQIASACGWSNARSLMNLFKRTFGHPMSTFRRTLGGHYAQTLVRPSRPLNNGQGESFFL